MKRDCPNILGICTDPQRFGSLGCRVVVVAVARSRGRARYG